MSHYCVTTPSGRMSRGDERPRLCYQCSLLIQYLSFRFTYFLSCSGKGEEESNLVQIIKLEDFDLTTLLPSFAHGPFRSWLSQMDSS
jgi:hypothetical protein